jgi:hypothetical protein
MPFCLQALFLQAKNIGDPKLLSAVIFTCAAASDIKSRLAESLELGCGFLNNTIS